MNPLTDNKSRREAAQIKKENVLITLARAESKMIIKMSRTILCQPQPK